MFVALTGTVLFSGVFVWVALRVFSDAEEERVIAIARKMIKDGQSAQPWYGTTDPYEAVWRHYILQLIAFLFSAVAGTWFFIELLKYLR